MATFTRKKLAFVQLSDTPSTDIYDPAASTIGLVHNIILFNANTTTETVILNMNDGTNAYQLFQVVLTTKDTLILDFKGEGLVVDASSKITGSTTTGSMVTCLVTGSEETA
jgi:hypothetical protein